MRATIDWSVGLLPEAQRDLLEDLGVFATRFTLEAVEALAAGRSWEGQELDSLAALVDSSLVKQTEIGGRSVFSLLAIVREYSLGRLKARGDADRVRAAHADYYVGFVRRVAPGLRGDQQAQAVVQLGLELPNLRAAVRHLVYTDRLDDAGDFAWSLLIYWWISGFFAEVRAVDAGAAREAARAAHHPAHAGGRVVPRAVGRDVAAAEPAGGGGAGRVRAAVHRERGRGCRGHGARRARDRARAARRPRCRQGRTGAAPSSRPSCERWATAGRRPSRRCRSGDSPGCAARSRRRSAHFDRATEVASAGGDLFTTSVAGNLRSRLNFQLGHIEEAEDEFVQTLLLSVELHYEEGVAYGLEGVCAVAAAKGDAWRAAALAVAAGVIRRRIGIFDVEAFTVHTPYLDILRGRDPEIVAAGEAAGAELSVPEAVRLALPEPDHAAVEDGAGALVSRGPRC